MSTNKNVFARDSMFEIKTSDQGLYELYKETGSEVKTLTRAIENNGFNPHFSTYRPEPNISLGFNTFIQRAYGFTDFTRSGPLSNKTFFRVKNPYELRITSTEKNIVEKSIENIVKQKYNSYVDTDNLAPEFCHSLEFQKLFTSEKKQLTIGNFGTNENPFVNGFKAKQSDFDFTFVSGSTADQQSSTSKRNICDIVLGDMDIEKYGKVLHFESALTKLLIQEVLYACKMLKRKGMFVVKLHETYTGVTLKVLELLSELFSDIYIWKPLTSRQMEPERYVICNTFHIASNQLILKLEELLEQITSSESNSLFLTLICGTVPSIPVVKQSLARINSELANKQFERCNEIIKYKKSNNYFGSEYHDSLSNQINMTNNWIMKFI